MVYISVLKWVLDRRYKTTFPIHSFLAQQKATLEHELACWARVLGIFACNWKYVADLLLLVLFFTSGETYRQLMSTLDFLDIT
jgi:hypothetical protein